MPDIPESRVERFAGEVNQEDARNVGHVLLSAQLNMSYLEHDGLVAAFPPLSIENLCDFIQGGITHSPHQLFRYFHERIGDDRDRLTEYLNLVIEILVINKHVTIQSNPSGEPFYSVQLEMLMRYYPDWIRSKSDLD